MEFHFSPFKNPEPKNKSAKGQQQKSLKLKISPSIGCYPNVPGVTVLQGPMAAIQKEMERSQQEQPFKTPQIELWEQGLNALGLPIPGRPTQVTLLTGSDFFLFCKQYNQGKPPKDPVAVYKAPSCWNPLAYLFPALRQARNRKQLKLSIQKHDTLIQNIKCYVEKAQAVNGQNVTRKLLGSQPENASSNEATGTHCFLRIV